MLSKNAAEGKAIVVIPLFQPLCQIFKLFDADFQRMPTIRPRPQILKKKGEDTVRYNVAVGETGFFTVFWDLPEVIGKSKKEKEKTKEKTQN
jgi:hypothetical protein